MLGDYSPECLCVLKRAAHEHWVVNALAVIREDTNLRLRIRHRAKFGELLSFKTNGNCTDWVNIRVTALTSKRSYLLNNTGGVGNRAGVCHCVNSGEATHRRSLRAGQNGFALFEAWLTKVSVQVDEAGHSDETAAVNSFDARETRAHRDDLVVLDLNVSRSPVSEVHVFEYEAVRHLRPFRLKVVSKERPFELRRRLRPARELLTEVNLPKWRRFQGHGSLAPGALGTPMA